MHKVGRGNAPRGLGSNKTTPRQGQQGGGGWREREAPSGAVAVGGAACGGSSDARGTVDKGRDAAGEAGRGGASAAPAGQRPARQGAALAWN